MLFLIREFLGVAGVSAARPFEVSPSSLVKVGARGRAGKRRSAQKREDQKFRGSTGSFATLLWTRSSKEESLHPQRIVKDQRFQECAFLVRIVALDCQFDESRLASSLLADKAFVFPDVEGAHCWHAVRVYMRCRLKAPESVVERWGSLMHVLWDSIGGWQPHRIASRLFMRQSQFLDKPSLKKLLANEIARKLLHNDAMNPYHLARYAWEEDSEEEESDASDVRVLRTSLRESSISKEQLRQIACPIGLLPAARDAISRAVRLSSTHGALAALPVHNKDDSKATPSVRTGKMARWMASEEALAWRIDRKALFPGAKDVSAKPKQKVKQKKVNHTSSVSSFRGVRIICAQNKQTKIETYLVIGKPIRK